MDTDTLQSTHAPFEMDSWEVEDIGGVLVELSHTRKIMCTCLPVDQYPLPWGHHEVQS